MWAILPSHSTRSTRRSERKIYQFVDYKGKRYKGIEGAKLLLSQQMKGIEEAVRRNMIVKINTVYIPGINEDHIPCDCKEGRRIRECIHST